jgi:hypothetical protein
MGDEHAAFHERTVEDDIVICTCQADLLDRNDIEIWPPALESTLDVVAGVLVPEESSYCR